MHHDAYTMLFLYVKWNTMVKLKTLIKIVRNYFDYFGICKHYTVQAYLNKRIEIIKGKLSVFFNTLKYISFCVIVTIYSATK